MSLGVKACCFREKCSAGQGPRGAISCDAANYYMDNTGNVQLQQHLARMRAQWTKRPREGSADPRSAREDAKAGQQRRTRRRRRA